MPSLSTGPTGKLAMQRGSLVVCDNCACDGAGTGPGSANGCGNCDLLPDVLVWTLTRTAGTCGPFNGHSFNVRLSFANYDANGLATSCGYSGESTIIESGSCTFTIVADMQWSSATPTVWQISLTVSYFGVGCSCNYLLSTDTRTGLSFTCDPFLLTTGGFDLDDAVPPCTCTLSVTITEP